MNGGRRPARRAPGGGRLVVVLGDQLAHDNPAVAQADRERDTVLMVEAAGEATHVRSHRARIAIFLAAMRHYAESLREQGFRVDYRRLGEHPTLAHAWRDAIAARKPASVVACEPGEWRVLADLQETCAASGVRLDVLPDPHFLCSRDAFGRWAGDAASLRMEAFYRWMRRRSGVLMDGDAPVSGRWNYDTENRRGFGAKGPGRLPEVPAFAPDEVTREAIADVGRTFPSHPGSLASFAWPVTRRDALVALEAFVRDRLPGFGRAQDAMWSGMAVGWHSRLSAALNLKLLDPREVIAAAEREYRAGRAELASVEGFVRQVLGWREFVRGVYWRDMPGLAGDNYFGHDRALPRWYWTGDTGMACLREAIGQTLEHGYAHHIQRLMVTGNFALLARVLPQDVCAWYLGVYTDAVEWAELPNTAGMALYANGGRFTSKPYAASGQYVKRMSNHCAGCRYDPARRTGADACPMTALFWRFLVDHERWLGAQPRTSLMAANAARLDPDERRRIVRETDRLYARLDEV